MRRASTAGPKFRDPRGGHDLRRNDEVPTKDDFVASRLSHQQHRAAPGQTESQWGILIVAGRGFLIDAGHSEL